MRTVLSADWVLPVESDPIRDGAVAVEDGRIAAVGTRTELGSDVHHGEAVLLPGFVNAHSHLEYAVYGGFGDGLSFAPWLAVHMERKRRQSEGDATAIARLGAAQCLGSGITTVGDCSFGGHAAVAAAELGLRAIVYLEVFGSDGAAAALRIEELRPLLEPHLSARVQLGISPHAPYSCAPELYAACLELGLPLATHLSESPDEDEWMRFGAGPWQAVASLLQPPPGTSGIRLLAERGLLRGNVIAAHCVVVDDEEIALLAEHDVAVAHCPRSNAYLGCGAAPLGDLRDAGIRVGLGTDSPASAPSFDLFDELRAAVMVARARARRPDALLTREALELATLGSAEALGLAGEIGSLAVGKRADLCVVSLEGSPFLPMEDPATAVVFGGSPERVLTTLVDGEARYEKGGFEWQELQQRAGAARSRMLRTTDAAVAAVS